jgi:membrane-bound lytic murein transglycosylase D
MKRSNERMRILLFSLGAAGLLALLGAGCSSTKPKPSAGEAPTVQPAGELPPATAVAETPSGPESAVLAEAELYFNMGVEASTRRRYEDAQYNFEKALGLLAELDPETEFTDAQSEHITRLLGGIGEQYQLVISAQGGLTEATEMSAFMMRFENLDALRTWRGYAEMQRALSPDTVTYDVPIVWNEKVKNCIIYFQTLARPQMELYLTRAGRYLPLMQEIFKEYEIPVDLCYLPIIESGFNTNAYSYARAMGPWQFIASTGRVYGLNRDWWRDQRKDFVRSTHGAARYLKMLYGMFGDWYLALAAYNGGEGRVQRTIRSQKTKDFWQMRLRKQTENYVPLYLAAVIIAKDPERFGFHIEPDTPLSFDVVTVDKPIELGVVAKRLGFSEDDLKLLNPELLRGVTPPQTKDYQLRVPQGHGEKFLAMYGDIPRAERTEWVKHQVRRGETLSTIAAKYGISVQAIRDANKMRGNQIIAGHQITVPVTMDRVMASAPSRQPAVPRATVTASPGDEYRVRAGDTMWDIARRHGTTVGTLSTLNKISGRRKIYPGQMLRIPGNASAPSDQSGNQVFTYVVRRGDNLSAISRKFGIGVNDIIELNKLRDPEQLAVGMRLSIPEVK